MISISKVFEDIGKRRFECKTRQLQEENIFFKVLVSVHLGQCAGNWINRGECDATKKGTSSTLKTLVEQMENV